MILLGHDDVVAQWTAARLGCRFAPPYVAIGRLDKTGTLVAAAVYTSYSHTNIELNLYASKPGVIGPQWWRYVVWDYPFGELGVQRITMRTRRSNKRVRRILARLGEFEGIAKRFYGPNKSDDAFCYGVFRESAIKFQSRRYT